MIEQDTIKLLRECDAGIKMGVASIDDVLGRVENKAFEKCLSDCKQAHEDLQAEIQGDEVACWGLKDHFGILCDGTVVPCCLDSDGIIALGNIFEEDVETILGSQRAQDMISGFERRSASEELCRRGGYAQRFV